MNGAELDQELKEGLTLIAESRWGPAEECLVARKGHGNRRLCLFLLSIVAASSGQEQRANDLWVKAQQAPLGELTVRYLDLQLAPNDPRQSVLLDLERAWWSFNGWSSQPQTSEPAPEFSGEVDWHLVVDCCLNGDCAQLESLYGQTFQDPGQDAPYLWNLLALSYLEAGNVRTYDEMACNAPLSPAANNAPPALVDALAARGLIQALEIFQRGEWLNYTGLSQRSDVARQSSQEISEEEWVAEMQNGFALLDLNKCTEASRSFQNMAVSVSDQTLRLMSLNALSLSFFKLGDYTQAETLYHEFLNLLESFPQDLADPRLKRYRKWLDSVDATPKGEECFFTPFDSDGESGSYKATETMIDFWQSLSTVLQHLSDDQHTLAKRELQALESQPVVNSDSKSYLITLTYLASAVMVGDHFEVQEFEQELNNLQAQTRFTDTSLERARETFANAGFDRAAAVFERFEQGSPPHLNPWQDL